ncbi:MAG TPA: HD domain-containing phosphohydrolase [Terracidiphilus sp.]|nr:HD domain-containing phosphohydrolase [Terracidiphilus sp.]
MSVVVSGAVVSLYLAGVHPAGQWLYFFAYLLAILLSSGMKVAMPKSDGTMSVNFPFILLGIVQLSPLQAVALAVASVIAQCRFKVVKAFTLVQILFNVANVTTATVLACATFAVSLPKVGREVAPALSIAATVYFLANTIPLALILGWESGNSPVRQWRQEFPWYFPFYLVGAVLAATANFIANRFGWPTSMLLIPMVYTVYRAYRAQMAIIRDREQHIVETEALHLRTIEGLAMAIEAKDTNTHRHLMRVRVYVSELGKIIGLDAEQMKALITAAYLHDIGKLAVPEAILNKPGKLNHAEFEKMKIHPVVGADILERVRFPYPVVPIVRSHHEAWDGSGYPDGLKGEEIPIGARILTAVDCFDALASDRPYRKAMPLDQALAMVKSKAGSQFDPEIVRLLEEHYQYLEQRAHQEMGEMAALNTELVIERGAAPGAGFAPGDDGETPKTQGDGLQPSGKETGDSGTGIDSREDDAIRGLRQSLIAARDRQSCCGAVSLGLSTLIPFDCLAFYTKFDDIVVAEFVDGVCAPAFSNQPIQAGTGVSGWVAQNGRPILNGNPTVEANFVAESGQQMTDASSAISIPLFDSNHDVGWVLTLYARKQAAFSKGHLAILEQIAPQFALALANHRMNEPAEPAAMAVSVREYRGAAT